MDPTPAKDEMNHPPVPSISAPKGDGEEEHRSGDHGMYGGFNMDFAVASQDPARLSPVPMPFPSPVHSLTHSDYSSLTSARRGSSAYLPSVSPEITNVDARRYTAIMPTHPEADSVSMSAMYNRYPSPSVADGEDGGNVKGVSGSDLRPVQSHQPSHFDCSSRQDLYIKRWSWFYVSIIFLSVYATLFSALWLFIALYQPHYGRRISNGAGWHVTPTTATLVAALFAKTIELSFATVFVAVLGQVLTRRAISRSSRGVTLAEMTMRNWVIQPGSLLTHWRGLTHTSPTILGSLTVVATISSLLYTTASDAMVSPKLQRQPWVMKDLQSEVKVSYSNPFYVRDNCQTPLNPFDPGQNPIACIDVMFSGQSYHSLIDFMANWETTANASKPELHDIANRPTGSHNLVDNTNMDSSWIEKEYSDPEASFRAHKRIINNVTLAMPHPGVYAAGKDPANMILQPEDLSGMGEYSIRASVVSPAVNVLCVNMNKEELAPLVYTEWPNARTQKTDMPGQRVGVSDWQADVPLLGSEDQWLNKTVVDDIFKWGAKYGRPPPAFQLYPLDYNTIAYASDSYIDAIYILAKNVNISDYTVCQLRSWVTPKCSTYFDLSMSGGYMVAHCEDPADQNAFERVYPDLATLTPSPSGDWSNLAAEWRLAINLNSGAENGNASNARLLSNLILEKPQLSTQLPSIAEALAVLATSTLVAGAQDSTFKPDWSQPVNPAPLGYTETFRAEVQTQEYSSAHTEKWHGVFYPIMASVFFLSLLCLIYLLFGVELTTGAVAVRFWKKKKAAMQRGCLPFPISFGRQTHGRVEIESSSDNDDDDDKSGYIHDKDNREAKAARGLVTDYSEPSNLFALAINSPPAQALDGACGDGPDMKQMGVPWRVAYSAARNHYYFEAVGAARSSGVEAVPMQSMVTPDNASAHSENERNYRRLSSRFTWL